MAKLPDIQPYINELPYDAKTKDALFKAFYDADPFAALDGVAGVPKQVKQVIFNIRGKAEQDQPFDLKDISRFAVTAPPPAAKEAKPVSEKVVTITKSSKAKAAPEEPSKEQAGPPELASESLPSQPLIQPSYSKIEEVPFSEYTPASYVPTGTVEPTLDYQSEEALAEVPSLFTRYGVVRKPAPKESRLVAAKPAAPQASAPVASKSTAPPPMMPLIPLKAQLEEVDAPSVLKDIARGFDRGLISTVASAAQALTRIPGGLRDRLTGLEIGSIRGRQEEPIQYEGDRVVPSKVGQIARERVTRGMRKQEEGLKPPPPISEAGKFTEALSSSAPYLAVGAVFGRPGTATLGALNATEEALRRLEDSGVSLTDNQKAGVVAAAALLGTTESLPIERLFKGLKAAGAVNQSVSAKGILEALFPSLKAIAKSGSKQFLAEGGQEAFAEIGQDVIQTLYGGRKPGDIGENVKEVFTTGGEVGFVLDLLTKLLGTRAGRARLRKSGVEPKEFKQFLEQDESKEFTDQQAAVDEFLKGKVPAAEADSEGKAFPGAEEAIAVPPGPKSFIEEYNEDPEKVYGDLIDEIAKKQEKIDRLGKYKSSKNQVKRLQKELSILNRRKSSLDRLRGAEAESTEEIELETPPEIPGETPAIPAVEVPPAPPTAPESPKPVAAPEKPAAFSTPSGTEVVDLTNNPPADKGIVAGQDYDPATDSLFDVDGIGLYAVLKSREQPGSYEIWSMDDPSGPVSVVEGANAKEAFTSFIDKPAPEVKVEAPVTPTGATEAPPAPGVTAPTAKPPVEETKPTGLPDWAREALDRNFAQAQKMGIVDRIAELSAQELTAQQVYDQIPELKVKPSGDPEKDITAVQDAVTLVRSVRNKLGIPSMDDRTAFNAWRESYLAKKKPPVEEPKVATEPPPPVVAAAPPMPPPAPVQPPAPPVAPKPVEKKSPPPERRLMIQRGMNDPVTVYFKDANDKYYFTTIAKVVGRKGYSGKDLSQEYAALRQVASQVAKTFKIPESKAQELLVSYREAVIEPTKGMPEQHPDELITEPLSFKEFVEQELLKSPPPTPPSPSQPAPPEPVKPPAAPKPPVESPKAATEPPQEYIPGTDGEVYVWMDYIGSDGKLIRKPTLLGQVKKSEVANLLQYKGRKLPQNMRIYLTGNLTTKPDKNTPYRDINKSYIEDIMRASYRDEGEPGYKERLDSEIQKLQFLFDVPATVPAEKPKKSAGKKTKKGEAPVSEPPAPSPAQPQPPVELTPKPPVTPSEPGGGPVAVKEKAPRQVEPSEKEIQQEERALEIIPLSELPKKSFRLSEKEEEKSNRVVTTYNGDTWHTNYHVLVKGEPPKYWDEGTISNKGNLGLNQILPDSSSKFKPVEPMAYKYWQKKDESGKTPKLVPSRAVLMSDGGAIDADYYRYIVDTVKPDSWQRGKQDGSYAAYKNGQPVAVVMNLRGVGQYSKESLASALKNRSNFQQKQTWEMSESELLKRHLESPGNPEYDKATRKHDSHAEIVSKAILSGKPVPEYVVEGMGGKFFYVSNPIYEKLYPNGSEQFEAKEAFRNKSKPIVLDYLERVREGENPGDIYEFVKRKLEPGPNPPGFTPAPPEIPKQEPKDKPVESPELPESPKATAVPTPPSVPPPSKPKGEPASAKEDAAEIDEKFPHLKGAFKKKAAKPPTDPKAAPAPAKKSISPNDIDEVSVSPEGEIELSYRDKRYQAVPLFGSTKGFRFYDLKTGAGLGEVKGKGDAAEALAELLNKQVEAPAAKPEPEKATPKIAASAPEWWDSLSPKERLELRISSGISRQDSMLSAMLPYADLPNNEKRQIDELHKKSFRPAEALDKYADQRARADKAIDAAYRRLYSSISSFTPKEKSRNSPYIRELEAAIEAAKDIAQEDSPDIEERVKGIILQQESIYYNQVNKDKRRQAVPSTKPEPEKAAPKIATKYIEPRTPQYREDDNLIALKLRSDRNPVIWMNQKSKLNIFEALERNGVRGFNPTSLGTNFDKASNFYSLLDAVLAKPVGMFKGSQKQRNLLVALRDAMQEARQFSVLNEKDGGVSLINVDSPGREVLISPESYKVFESKPESVKKSHRKVGSVGDLIRTFRHENVHAEMSTAVKSIPKADIDALFKNPSIIEFSSILQRKGYRGADPYTIINELTAHILAGDFGFFSDNGMTAESLVNAYSVVRPYILAIDKDAVVRAERFKKPGLKLSGSMKPSEGLSLTEKTMPMRGKEGGLSNIRYSLSTSNPPSASVVKKEFQEAGTPDKYNNTDKDDNFYYHVTTKPAANQIKKTGIFPRKSGGAMSPGFYSDYSKGKAFFSERSGVSYWADVISRHIENQTGKEPNLVVLRFPKDMAVGLEVDEVGSKDSGRPSYYVKGNILGEKYKSNPLSKENLKKYFLYHEDPSSGKRKVIATSETEQELKDERERIHKSGKYSSWNTKIAPSSSYEYYMNPSRR